MKKLPTLVGRRLLWPIRGGLSDSLYQDLPTESSQFSLTRPTKLDEIKNLRVEVHPGAAMVLRREPRPARSGPRQASFPCPHQPARADYSPSCQADMAAIRPPLTVSGASQASLRHPPASFGIRPRCFLAAAAPSASRYGSSRSPCELRKPRSSVPLRTGPVSRNCNAWGQINTILIHKKA